MTPDDLILAFFPCTFFEAQSQLWFSGNNYAQAKWLDIDKCECAMKRHKELGQMYELLNKLVCVCLRKNYRMVIENPYMQPHYLTTYWCIKPKIIDSDRTKNGDYFKKPTQYWFINFEPSQNLVFEPLDYVEQKVIAKLKKGDKSVKVQRSEIHPQYANRFIRQYLI